ncbi:MAG TPA: hypothetical protein PLY72_13340 [Candidatus Obscuribacter sp.]|nr:hypothetical protein [Candidatus Obscuribacter sp.]
MDFACKVAQVFELKDVIAVVADRSFDKRKPGLSALLLRRPDGTELKATSRPVMVSYGLEAPEERKQTIHLEKMDRSERQIKKSDIPIGTEIWFCDERELDVTQSPPNLKEVI